MNILLECMPVEMNIEYFFIMTHIQRCQPVCSAYESQHKNKFDIQNRSPKHEH